MRLEVLAIIYLAVFSAYVLVNSILISLRRPESTNLRADSEFIAFMREIFEDIDSLNSSQCRYSSKDSQSYGLDTVKIIRKPDGGYLGIYHSNMGGVF